MKPKHMTRMMGFSAGLVAALALAQTPSESPQQTPFAVRTTTQLVEVTVLAVDHSGNAVTNLRADDFELTDNGKPQEVAVFSLQKSGAAAAAPAPQPQPRGLFSNRSVEASQHNVTVILIDDTNPDTLGFQYSAASLGQDLAYARQEIRKFFGKMGPQDSVALYAADKYRGLQVLQDLTNDPAALVSALDRYVPPPLPPPVASAPLQVNASPGSSLGADLVAGAAQANQFVAGSQQEYSLLGRADTTAATFQAIEEHLAAAPGRKALVWMSTGFPTGLLLPYQISSGVANPYGLSLDPHTVWPGTLRPEIEKVARAFNNANLAVYPVDIRGFYTQSGFDLGVLPAPGGSGGANVAAAGAAALPEGQEEIATMTDIASRTGGRAFYGTNDLTSAIRQAADDGRVVYTLGFYPTDTQWDGSFHTVRVKATRPGVAVRYRKGYFALPPEQLDADGRQRALMAAALSPLDATAIGLTVRAVRWGAKDDAQVEIELFIAPQSVSFSNSDGRWKGEIEMAVVELDAQGNTLKAYDHKRAMALRPDLYTQVAKEGFRFPVSFKLLPDTQRIRVVVRDNTSGTLGSVNLPLNQIAVRKG